MHSLANKFHIQLIGDHAFQFKLNSSLNNGIDQDLLALSNYLKDKKIQGVKDFILAYDTITLIYDILYFDSDPYILATDLLEGFANESINAFTTNNAERLIEIPVCYDLSLGIDLQNAAMLSKNSIEGLIQQHTATTYHVFCLGFLPGFAYMGDVPSKIQLPRHASPRAKVLAGSVGIAGKQTGIYPMDSPGGWQIIGRTPLKIFDPNSARLTLFKAGDQVQFKAISLEMFHQLNKHEDVD